MRPSTLVVIAAGLGLSCIAAAPSGPIFFPGREYGLGERQTYLIDRDARLTVRLEGPNGVIVSKSTDLVDERSVAFTVEGYTDAGMPVLAVATAVRGGSNTSDVGSSATSSPIIETDGSVPSDTFAGFAPSAALMNGLDPQALDIGTIWTGRGDLPLPFARAAVKLKGQVNFKSGELDDTLLQALLTGTASITGHPRVAPFGALHLTGGGVVAGNAFISPPRRLVLGMELTLTSYGNVTDAHGRHGAYVMNTHWSIKLASYAPGILPGPGISPGIGIPVTQMGAPAPAATNVYSQSSPSDVFAPASVNSDVIDKSNASAPPTAAPSPDESLPPIPVSIPSDQPVASPPPGPSPTPS
jgi:hypothetical protein